MRKRKRLFLLYFVIFFFFNSLSLKILILMRGILQDTITFHLTSYVKMDFLRGKIIVK